MPSHLVTTPQNMSVSILLVCIATHVPWWTGRTQVALVELPGNKHVWFLLLRALSSWNSSLELCRTPVALPPSTGFKILSIFICFEFQKKVILDCPTPATQNGLEHVICRWPRWMFCKPVTKHKLCILWCVLKACFVGNAKSLDPDGCFVNLSQSKNCVSCDVCKKLV